MRTGYIILVRNPWQWQYPFSSVLWWLIRWASGSPFNHVAMFWEAAGEPMIVEADGRGVCATHYNYWLRRAKREIRIVPLECAPESFTVHLGKRYDYISLLGYCLLKVLKRKWYGPGYDAGTKRLYCFGLVAYAHGFEGANQILPNEFLAQVEARTSKKFA